MPLVGTRGVMSSRGLGEFLGSGPVGPVNTVAPAVTGVTVQGNTLSCTTGSWTGTPTITYTYQWRDGVSNIGGATSNTYVLQSSDVGLSVDCVVTATNISGSTNVESNIVGPITASLTPVNTVAPVVSGGTVEYDTLSCTTGSWANSPTSYTYQWYDNSAPIISATSSTYNLQASDVGHLVSCKVTAYNINGSGLASSNLVGPVTAAVAPPVNTVAPVASGGVIVGDTVSCTTGTWTGAGPITYTYQWTSGLMNIPFATSNTYVLQASDDGNNINCIVRAYNVGGGQYAGSNTLGPVIGLPVNTVAPVISGNAWAGGLLSCTTGSWTNSPTGYTYQWYNSSIGAISGATSSSYSPQGSDVGYTIHCIVFASNTAGTSALGATSNTTANIVYVTPVNTVAPVLTGSPLVGFNLVCTTGTWDNDPTGYAYTWENSNTGAIPGANLSFYTVQSSDVGAYVYCDVTASNPGYSSTAPSNNIGPIT